MLKGFIAYNGGEILKIHDLGALNKACKGYNPCFSTIEEECTELTDYAVQIRYPFHIDLEEEDVTLAIESTKKVINFIRSVLNDIEIPER